MALFSLGVCNFSEELIEVGKIFGRTLRDGDVVALQGDLGAGKTTLTKGIACALGVKEVVTSPTFNIVSQYEGDKMLIHIDAYRLDAREFLNVMEDAEHPFVIVVEWPEKLPELHEMITKTVAIEIEKNGSRVVTLVENSS